MSYYIDRKESLTLWERLYIPEVARGLWVTLGHLLHNLFHIEDRMTIEYPDKKKTLPPGYRAEHRLMSREDGQIRCTACMLCQTICPADCIEIIAEESPDKTVEKRPKEFFINELRCVFCGLCVEACPCDAIRMDTGKYENSSFTRRELIYDIRKLAGNHPEGASPISAALY
ncbi:MAG: NADH-quinone oxidoreductase subunit I [Deltaproteobacteria bacterium]|nr:NADH-quinone oxidoreductase subunit I [Deltaproteobacteria bacterium]